MNRRLLTTIAVAVLGLVALVGFEVRVALRQRAEITAAQEKQHQLVAELASLRRAQTRATAEAEQSEQQLASLPKKAVVAPDLTPEQRGELDRWLVRLRKLRAHFAAHPEQRTPEMQLLNDDDWLRVTKTLSLENDDSLRAAAAALRTAAMGHFTSRLSAAMRRYNKTTTDRPPSIQALVPYFDGFVDPAMLERYEFVQRFQMMGVGPNGPKWGVTNASAVDPDYDSRTELAPTGGMSSGSGLRYWLPGFAQQERAALARFQGEKPRQTPTGIADLLPYFDPPLNPAMAERLKRAEAPR